MKRKIITLVMALIMSLIICYAEEPQVAVLSPEEEIELVTADEGRLGDLGRLYIPSVDVDVAVFQCKETGRRAQEITNNTDSAAWCPSFYGGCGYIADHWTQGFINIRDCEEDCRAYVKTEDGIKIYECVKNTTGYNKEKYLITEDGENLKNIEWADFCCYTCDGNWRNIIMVFFKEYVEESIS